MSDIPFDDLMSMSKEALAREVLEVRESEAELRTQIATLQGANAGLIEGIRDGAAMFQECIAERDRLQRQVDHLKISLQVFGNLTVVYGANEATYETSIVCPDCMHKHMLHPAPVTPGTRRSYQCPKCKSSVSVIFGFDGDQIIEVKERRTS